MKPRTLIALSVTGAVAFAGVAVAPAPAATADRSHYGFRIASTGDAAGSWIGSRSAARRVVYRIDAGARPGSPSYGAVFAAQRINGTGPKRVTRRDTARAAYVLSKYGRRAGNGGNLQAAAVDVTLYHLLYGGAYGLNGSKTKARLRQSGQGSTIREWALFMLKRAAKYAGPYKVAVSAPGTVVGGTVPVTIRVRSYSGAAMEKLPVYVSYPGTSRVSLQTDSTGKAKTTFDASASGYQRLRVSVGQLPEARLLVRKPTRRGASRLVVADVKRSRPVARTVAIQARPRVAVYARSSNMRTGGVAMGRFKVVDGSEDASRTATVRLFGPFRTEAAATCGRGSGEAVHVSTVRVRENNFYKLPGYRVTKAGYYIWRVGIAGNDVNLPTATCGATTLAKVRPVVSATAPNSPVARGARIRALVRVRYLPSGYRENAAVRLFGPFKSASAIRCGTSLPNKLTWLPITKSGAYWSTRVKVTKPGYYGWQVRVAASPLSTAVTTRCRAPGSMLRVR